jgi:hypothetical protein
MADLTLVLSSVILFEIGRVAWALLESITIDSGLEKFGGGGIGRLTRSK